MENQHSYDISTDVAVGETIGPMRSDGQARKT